MCKYKFILGQTKSTILVIDVDNEGCYLSAGAEDTWGTSASPSQFCCKSKTPLKKKPYKRGLYFRNNN